MALSGGKRLTELPSGTNIGVKTQNFASVLDPVLKATEEKINYDEKQSELSFQREGIDFNRNVALQKEKNQELINESNVLKAEQKLHSDAVETTHDISLGNAILQLENESFNLALANPNNPTKIAEGINNFYNTIKKTNPEWLQNNDRAFKFLEKKDSLFRAEVGASVKKHRTYLGNESWDIMNELSQKYSAEVIKSIVRMDTVDDLSNFLEISTSSMNSIQTGFQQWFDKNGYLGLHNEHEASEIVMKHVFERDTALLTHVITEFAMDIDNPQSIDMATSMLEHYASGELPSKYNGPIKRKNTLWNNRPLEYNKKGEITNPYKDFRPLLEIIKEYTYGNHTAETREKIINTVETAITNKKTEWNNLYKTANNEKLKELNIVADEYNKNVKIIGTNITPKHILDSIFVIKDPDSIRGDLITNEDAVLEYQSLESTNVTITEIVNDILKGNVTTDSNGRTKRTLKTMAEIEERFNNIDPENLKKLGYNIENGINIIKDAAIREAFGGADFNVISMLDSINTNVGEGQNNILDDKMTNGINMMKELNYIPHNINQHFKNATLLSFDDESDFSTIAKIAIFKNKVLGTDDNKAFDTIKTNGKDSFNKIINRVFELVEAGRVNEAGKHWKTFLNPSEINIAERNTAVNNFNNVKNEFGQNIWEEYTAKITDAYINAVEQEDITSVDFYTSGLSNWWNGRDDAEQDDYLKGGTGDDNSVEASFRNIIKNKNTFAYGANIVKGVTAIATLGIAPWQGSNYKENMQLGTSAQNFIIKYMEENIMNHIDMDNPNEQHIRAAYESVYKAGVKAIANNGLEYDYLGYYPEYPNGNMYVLQGDAVAGNILDGSLKSHQIQENALQFMWQHTQNNNNTADEFAAAYFGFGVKANDLTIKQLEEYKNNFMSMVGTNQIKIKVTPETRSQTNPSYNIFVDQDGDGLHTVYTNNGVPVEWFPNDQFTKINQGYSKDGLAKNWASDIINGKTSVGGKDLEQILKKHSYLNIENPRDKEALILILEKQIKYENWINNKLQYDDKVNTLSEYQTTLAKSFNNWNTIKKSQEKSKFENEEARKIETIYQIKKSYHPELFDAPDNSTTRDKFEKISSIAKDTYNKTYNDIDLPAQYEFVITDIIETLSDIKEVKINEDKYEWKMTNNKKWKTVVGKDSEFYKYLEDGQYRSAKTELENLFKTEGVFTDEQLQKRKLLLDMWGVGSNQ